MRIVVKFDLCDLDLRGIAYEQRRRRRATRDEAKQFIQALVADTVRRSGCDYLSDPEVRKMRARKLSKLGPGLGMKASEAVV